MVLAACAIVTTRPLPTARHLPGSADCGPIWIWPADSPHFGPSPRVHLPSMRPGGRVLCARPLVRAAEGSAMSDMSLPPLQFVPTETSALADLPPAGAAASGGDAFAWPTPPLACYPAPVRAATPEVCEIEGLNGKTITGRLMHFNPAEALVKLRVTHANARTISLRFDQFRRLRLMQPLAALPVAGRPAASRRAGAAADAAVQACSLHRAPRMRRPDDRPPARADYGLFLFEPLDDARHGAALVRAAREPTTAPRSACASARCWWRRTRATPEQVRGGAGRAAAAAHAASSATCW